MVKDHSDSERGNTLPPHGLLFPINSNGFYMHHPTDRMAHKTAFVTPVVEHWLEREIAQWVHPMKDRSDDPSLHERTLLPRSYISLHAQGRPLNETDSNATMKLQMICGATGLHLIPPNTPRNRPKYVGLLKAKLKLHVHVHGCTIFMHDGYPRHRSKVATESLKKNKISVLELPGNSPYLYPVEKLDYYETTRLAIEEVWVNEITQEYCI